MGLKVRFKDVLKKDFPASIAVFVVAIPLCLGIAYASGAPPVSGILAGIIGGILVGSISNSALSVSGPAAGLTAIVLAGISKLGSFEALLTATCIAGILQMITGIFKLGFVTRYVPLPVIKGMLSGIGFILLLNQLPLLFGINQSVMEIIELFINDLQFNSNQLQSILISNFNLHISLIGILSTIVLLIWNKINHDYLKIIPASVVVVLIGIALIMIIEHYFYDGDMNEKYFVTLPEIANWSDLQSIFTLPDFNVLKHINTYEVALTLFVVAALESLLSVAAIDKIDPKFRKTDPDSELIAQGIGNFFAGLIGAIPITAVIVRGSVNVSAGAKSKFSAILHGVLLLLSLLFLSQIINLIPLSALAAILCFTGFKLIDPSEIKRLFRQDKRAFFIFLFTVAGILITDFLIGVISGSILAYILHYQNNKHKSEILFTNLGKEKHIHLKGNIGLPDKNKISYLTKEIDEKSLYIIVIEKNCELDIDSFQIIEEWLKKLDQKQVQYSIIQYGKNYFLK